MSKQFKSYQPEQNFLLPPSLLEFVPAGHVAHFIRDLVSKELNLREIYESYEEDRGAPPFSPAMMTALLLYSYSRNRSNHSVISRA